MSSFPQKMKFLMPLLVISLGIPNLSFAQEKPNIVFILLDNFGWGEPGFNGGGIIRGAPTTNMDKLADEGIRLTNFNVEAQCTPSRAGIMTGRYGVRSGNHQVPYGGGVYGLVQWEITMAEMLKEVGYNTAMLGKWHLGWSEGRYPTNQGFDKFYGIESTDQTVWSTQRRWQNLNREAPVVKEGVAGTPATQVREYNFDYRKKIDGDLTKKAANYIAEEAKNGSPFFLYLAYTATHLPIAVDDEFNGLTGNGQWADLLLQTDTYVGRVIAALDDAGIADDTIVIFAADNGPEAGNVGSNNLAPVPHTPGLAGPFRGSLFSPLEGSMRVPAVIRWPGKIRAGSESNEIFHAMDIYPTLASITGGSVPKDRPIDGVDQTDFLLGKQQKSNRDSVIIYMGAEMFGVKWQDWKILFKESETIFSAAEKTIAPKLYDLIADPGERQDVFFTYTWVGEEAIPKMLEHAQSLKEYPPIPPGTPDPYIPPTQ